MQRKEGINSVKESSHSQFPTTGLSTNRSSAIGIADHGRGKATAYDTRSRVMGSMAAL
jgi:hypothetical protein